MPSLSADCSSCFGLCCVALPFAKSADFAFDKAAGTPCRHLAGDYRCGIHSQLRERGMAGCTVFDCFGAGQQVSQVTFGGHESPQAAAVFPVMRGLHELLWYLTEALALPAAAPLRDELRRALDDIERLTELPAAELTTVDVPAVRGEVNELLLRVSERARQGVPGRRKNHRGADLIGAKLRGANLRGASLRGAYLIGADLREADLRSADVIGADFRGADLRGADLTGSLFLTRIQVAAARGDATTRLPEGLTPPAHWASPGTSAAGRAARC
ncbi:hypothetical protein FHX82_005374 [Amycolatopsis bartoniae]|uniref:Pentapeptide repeat-containing protein n=1 Tax=Amycolatopsis bartoniae TaxID=941986 RepID=A0A8H9M8E7_9PSEU|nr:pentapeptide repeat-containing protein [Amycolatopsis bartoniae]MBB2938298.1 hypothetical protein [Amycolatopsis bartoniae]TVT09064.1 pentapeptide repeat-containing protein [Amycolatopsis bartoniae]GHF34129.1 hypothetical protein GCM10017566_03520 [Amycolatopsis bartoniae]